ncbi:hypothetical protein HMPREF2822_03830 [Corynebacterium sp. HMSC062E11]|uniref:TIGR02391 family protein n=1 Tax=Corynebacterium sp. HMSC062E11 TaxID=1739326 RepID=UPI0008A5B1CB|nr:TIGR02391 family protein [Corynebacterium sp. HMSC062E11]OFK29403.1 hypothetical protein HMPREF2822_03830 [Corynebacterium sp. HMSC062E11]
MPLPDIIRRSGTRVVTLIREPGPTEQRVEVEASILNDQGIDKAYVAKETPVYEGDIIELPEPRGGKMRFFAQKVVINDLPNGPFANMAYTEVHLSKELPPRTAPVRRLSFEGLHPAVAEASADLFADGHFSRAVSEAFKSIEIRVRDLLASRTSGTKLMDEAFGGKAPRLSVSLHAGRSGQDEQAGFHAIFRGATLGIRNPGAHELAVEQDAQEALEYLALASLLHRRLDNSIAE